MWERSTLERLRLWCSSSEAELLRGLLVRLRREAGEACLHRDPFLDPRGLCLLQGRAELIDQFLAPDALFEALREELNGIDD